MAALIEDITLRYYFTADRGLHVKSQTDQGIPMGVMVDVQFESRRSNASYAPVFDNSRRWWHMRARTSHKGMVLIFSLWVLGILTILAVSVAAGIRQKIFLVARLDERSRMNYLLQAAVKKTAGYIHQQMEESSFTYTPAVKMNLHNNTHELSQIILGHDEAAVVWPSLGSDSSGRWGVVDEESKINLNKTDPDCFDEFIDPGAGA